MEVEEMETESEKYADFRSKEDQDNGQQLLRRKPKQTSILS